MLTADLYQSWDDSHADTNYPFTDAATLLAADGASSMPIGAIADAVVGVRSTASPVYVIGVEVSAAAVTINFGQDGAVIASASIDSTTTGWVALTSHASLLYAGKIKIDAARAASLFGLGIGAHAFDVAATPLVPYVLFFSPVAGVRGISLPDGRVITGMITLCIGSGLDATVAKDVVSIHAVGLPYQGRDAVNTLRRAIRSVRVDASSGDGTSGSVLLRPVRGAIAAFTDATPSTKSPAIVINGSASTVGVEVSS
jgi:hypothetical protein